MIALLYRAIYAVTAPLYPVLRAIAPKHVTTTEQVGRAMITVAAPTDDRRVPRLASHNRDINAIG